jgi:hypothetical protein
VTRVARTGYSATYTLRDAHLGKVIDYSWPRGAALLIKNKFLAK